MVPLVRRTIPRADFARKLADSSNLAETASTAEAIHVNVQDHSVGVLAYYAVLAYPKRIEMAKREAFFMAMKTMRIKEFAGMIPGVRKNIPPSYTGLKNEKIDGAIRRGWGRLLRRIRAGVAGWCVVLNEKPILLEVPAPTGEVGFILHGPNTVNRVMNAIVGGGRGDPKEATANAAHRTWAESLPVLHLAMKNPVTVKIVEELVNSGETSPSETSASKQINKELLDSIHESGWLRESLEGAEELRLTLPALLGTKPGDHLGRGFKSEFAIRLIPREPLS